MGDIADTSRVFIALWPDPPVRERLALCRDRWVFPADAAPVATEHLHLTLHFIGNVARSRVAELANGLQLPFEPFDLCFGSTALWAHGIAVLEPDALPPALLALHAALADRLQALSFPLEDRAFRPHITMARRAQRSTPPACPPAMWPVRDYALVESRPARAGGYLVLRRYG